MSALSSECTDLVTFPEKRLAIRGGSGASKSFQPSGVVSAASFMNKAYSSRLLSVTESDVSAKIDRLFLLKERVSKVVVKLDEVSTSVVPRADLRKSETRLQELSEIRLGGKFEVPPSKSSETVKFAGVLLRKLASSMPDVPLPLLGLDGDGSIVMTYNSAEDELFGSICVFEDFTFSLYVERKGKSVSLGDVPIDAPLPQPFSSLFLE